jgi:hypothetical protein
MKKIIVEQLKKLITEKGDGALLFLKYLNASFDDVNQAYNELGLSAPIALLRSQTSQYMTIGWGNGYVRIPEGHEYYDKNYNEIDVSVHGGLTFSEHITDGNVLPKGFWVGFDTAHYGDDSTYWTKDRVFEETINLFSQIYGLSK